MYDNHIPLTLLQNIKILILFCNQISYFGGEKMADLFFFYFTLLLMANHHISAKEVVAGNPAKVMREWIRGDAGVGRQQLGQRPAAILYKASPVQPNHGGSAISHPFQGHTAPSFNPNDPNDPSDPNERRNGLAASVFCSGRVGFFVDPAKNCVAYVFCSADGTMYKFQCPAGLWYSEVWGACMPRDVVVCEPAPGRQHEATVASTTGHGWPVTKTSLSVSERSGMELFNAAFSNLILQQILAGKPVKVTLERESKLIFQRRSGAAPVKSEPITGTKPPTEKNKIQPESRQNN